MNRILIVTTVICAALLICLPSVASYKKVNWGKWTDWPECPVTCGGAKIVRIRRCIPPEVEGRSCIRYRRRLCGRRRCPTEDPLNVVTATSAGQVDKSSTQETTTTRPTLDSSREPDISKEAPKPTTEGTASPDPEATTEEIASGDEAPETEPEKTTPADPEPESVTKEYIEWTQWTECDVTCGGGKTYRTRECISKTGERECEDAEELPCNSQPCLVDTSVGEPDPDIDNIPTPEGTPESHPEKEGDKNEYVEWSEWSRCDVTCGGGKSYRIRECVDETGEEDCEDAEELSCNTHACPDDAPPDTKPTPEGSSETSSEATDVDSNYTTAETQTDANRTAEEEPDNKDQDVAERRVAGIPEPWSDWSDCTRPCGIGDSFRTRKCPEITAQTCVERQTRLCNRFRCPDVYTPWTAWSPCGKSCGEGLQFRSRVCVNNTGRDDCQLFKAQACNTNPCPDVDVEETTAVAPITVNDTTTTTEKVTPRNVHCGDSAVGASRYLYFTAVSPGFPNNYTGGLDCMWTISSPENYRVEVVIDKFEVDPGDKFTLLEGRPRELSYREARIVTLRGVVESGIVYTSVGRYMTVRLQTRTNTNGGSYTIRFKAISKCNIPVC